MDKKEDLLQDNSLKHHTFFVIIQWIKLKKNNYKKNLEEKQEEYLKLKAEEEEKDKFFNDLKNRAEEVEDWEDLCDI